MQQRSDSIFQMVEKISQDISAFLELTPCDQVTQISCHSILLIIVQLIAYWPLGTKPSYDEDVVKIIVSWPGMGPIMETFSVLLALYEGNSPVTNEFP